MSDAEYNSDLNEFAKQKDELHDTDFPFGKPYPIMNEKHSESGTASGQYFWQDLLVAQRIYINNPQKHIDVGSRVDGFVAHVASYREINEVDIRPLKSNIKNVAFIQQDFMAELNKIGNPPAWPGDLKGLTFRGV
jgi:hypothetical protein